jgi:hypothetical protein
MKTYYTPREYEAAFHEPWGDRDAVYFLDYTDTDEGETGQRFWRIGAFGEIKEFVDDVNGGEVLCATTHCPVNNYIHYIEEKKEGEKNDAA